MATAQCRAGDVWGALGYHNLHFSVSRQNPRLSTPPRCLCSAPCIDAHTCLSLVVHRRTRLSYTDSLEAYRQTDTSLRPLLAAPAMGARSVPCAEPRKFVTVTASTTGTAAPTPSVASPRTVSTVGEKMVGSAPLPPRSCDLVRPVTRSLHVSSPPTSSRASMSESYAISCPESLEVTLPTYPFPPPREPLAIPLASKNPPRKSLLKRWRAKRISPTSVPYRALVHLRTLENVLEHEESEEIVAYTRLSRRPTIDDIPRIRRHLENVKPKSRDDIVRLATRLFDSHLHLNENDKVTLALHELKSQDFSQIQVILGRDRGAIGLETSERLQFVREQIAALKASGVESATS